ncbi:GNAT family N-acetyltransferase [Thalassococcus sp. S3]|uniref:GNAT family N-acetyltransferase n=1 Tax=Thalassococcus sp. S3 TaxID=2017482 RepID=UPI0010248290|nr:GNAT family N-acetyltransferase [Thalassococcus sp. S3]QBF31292.1 hypothetical protein CFI11_08685 [Thalassococcus sp. S3]
MIRAYRSEDHAACYAVFRRAVLEGARDFYSAAERDVWAGPAETDPGKPDKLLDQWCWVAEKDNDIRGFMSLTKDGYLDMAFVLPEEMGKGTARELYDALITKARTEGFDRLTVHASHLARRFFIKQGWQVEYAEEHAKGGQVFERFYMSLNLKETV